MLANNARQSVSNNYPHQDGSWNSSKCWIFPPGQYWTNIYSTNVEPVFPASNAFSESFWLYIPSFPYPSDQWFKMYISRKAYVVNNTWKDIVGSIYIKRFSNSLETGLGLSYRTGSNDVSSSSQWYTVPLDNSFFNRWVNITITGTNSSSEAFKAYHDGVLQFSTGDGSNDFNISTGTITGYNHRLGPNDESVFIAEYGQWDVALDTDAVTAICGSGSLQGAIDFNADSGNYDNADDLVTYYRFGDGAGDSTIYPYKLHDETNSDHVVGESDGDRDFTSSNSSFQGTLYVVQTSQLG